MGHMRTAGIPARIDWSELADKETKVLVWR